MSQNNVLLAKNFLDMLFVTNPHKISITFAHSDYSYKGDNPVSTTGYDDSFTPQEAVAKVLSRTDVEYDQCLAHYAEILDPETGQGTGESYLESLEVVKRWRVEADGSIGPRTPEQGPDYTVCYTSPGYKAARVYKRSPDGIQPDILMGAFDPQNPRIDMKHLVSFLIPQDDPNYDQTGNINPSDPSNYQGYRLQQRIWIYDLALAIYAYTILGETSVARSLIERALYEQEEDGSFPFSFDIFCGMKFVPPYVRSGACAWLGAAMCYYMRRTGDTVFLAQAQAIADWLLSIRNMNADDPRYGLVTGGEGSFDLSDYRYIPGRQYWCSVEHNFDCHMFFRELYNLTLDDRYKEAYQLIQNTLLKQAWIESEGRFAQGVRAEGPDLGWALDMTTWGGLFLTSIQEWGKAERCFETAQNIFLVSGAQMVENLDPEHYNKHFVSTKTFTGMKPYYDDGNPEHYPGAPNVVWAEGTWGLIMLGKRLNKDVSVYEESMYNLQTEVTNTFGGLPAYTETHASLPWEFHTWPAVSPTCWLILTNLDPFYSVFPMGLRTLGGVNEVNRIKPLAKMFTF